MRISDWSSDVCSSDLQRWGARTLDLDILLWSGGAWSDDRLTIPHPAMAERPFVLGPLTRIAPGWRHPLAARSISHIATTLSRSEESRVGKASDRTRRTRGWQYH